jgi:hypothetical protein
MSCPRPGCGGCTYDEREPFTHDIYIGCLNCGWRQLVPMDPQAEPAMAARWATVLCQHCHRQPARLGLNTCEDCRGMPKCRTQKVA